MKIKPENNSDHKVDKLSLLLKHTTVNKQNPKKFRKKVLQFKPSLKEEKICSRNKSLTRMIILLLTLSPLTQFSLNLSLPQDFVLMKNMKSALGSTIQ